MRFTQYYFSPTEPIKENFSNRVKVRLGTYITQVSHQRENYNYNFRKQIQRDIGLRTPSSFLVFENFFEEIEEKDLLDILTIVFNCLDGYHKLNFINFVNQCFKEEGLAYIIESNGGVRYSPDEEFEANRLATLQNLSELELKAAKDACEMAYKEFHSNDEKKNKSALRYIFEANEILFKKIAELIKPSEKFDQLNERNIKKIQEEILALIARSSDETAKNVTRKLIQSFVDWVDGIHFYRHGQASDSYNPPPIELTILALSNGASYLRWLASIYKIAKVP